jgi:hypothetical protein
MKLPALHPANSLGEQAVRLEARRRSGHHQSSRCRPCSQRCSEVIGHHPDHRRRPPLKYVLQLLQRFAERRDVQLELLGYVRISIIQ